MDSFKPRPTFFAVAGAWPHWCGREKNARIWGGQNPSSGQESYKKRLVCRRGGPHTWLASRISVACTADEPSIDLQYDPAMTYIKLERCGRNVFAAKKRQKKARW
jgi:ribosomal protein L37E